MIPTAAQFKLLMTQVPFSEQPPGPRAEHRRPPEELEDLPPLRWIFPSVTFAPAAAGCLHGAFTNL